MKAAPYVSSVQMGDDPDAIQATIERLEELRDRQLIDVGDSIPTSGGHVEVASIEGTIYTATDGSVWVRPDPARVFLVAASEA